ncbi:TetR/AcrR family transcriptional regulator [Lederbergia lenta]|uniref:Transcriptional regulator n=1 Tax=Lederbergia lenta TaxID=1467 RepID=A0A2X4VW74_LEDLE|nr:TetR/AcrR family transcriptional regulator [Lederbergia lenta]MEC2324986.1 TetR/AcrR family transcriptional regulator [Lederbergia lenta]SQI56517.1 transcriptional regulator [Lederbergia lenta]
MLNTSDKILQAALTLMQDKGYQSVSIKEIAHHAEVSEMTVFRYFKTKMGVFESAVEKFSYIPCFEKIFAEQIIWDLETDLTLIAKSYFDLMNKNKSIFLIAIQERSDFPELNQVIAKNTMKLKSLIISYFTSMQERNQMKEVNVEAQAIIFLTTLYGYFSSTSLWKDHFLHEWEESFLLNTIDLFCEALKK